MRIKLKGGPKDGEWVEVGSPPPTAILFHHTNLPNDDFLSVLTKEEYRLCLYKTTRFGGRKFYRYIYKETRS